MSDKRELKAIKEILSKTEASPDFSRIFTNFSHGRNHAVIEWALADNDAIIKRIWGDFRGLTSYEADKCIGLSINTFLDEQGKAGVQGLIQHALEVGFVAKKTAIYTSSGDIKYISGILYRHDSKTLIELMFNPIGVEL